MTSMDPRPELTLAPVPEEKMPTPLPFPGYVSPRLTALGEWERVTLVYTLPGGNRLPPQPL